MPSALQEELKAFHRWCTLKFYGQQHEPIADVTAQKYLDHIRCDTSACSAWLITSSVTSSIAYTLLRTV